MKCGSCSGIGVGLIVGLAVVLTASQGAVAQLVPFKASGAGAEYDPATGAYEGPGTGTHLGKCLFIGTVDLAKLTPLPLPDDDPAVFFRAAFCGFHSYVAANGDVLAGDFTGEVSLSVFDLTDPDKFATGRWDASFVVDQASSTGRFANASGEVDLVAINPPFDPTADVYPFYWVADGELDLGKKAGN